MPNRDPSRLMWAEACEMLDRANRLQRQFFRPRSAAAWEPPVDVYETAHDLWIVAARAEGARDSVPSVPADAMIILPMRNTVLFPGMVLPLGVGRERSVAAAQEAVREQRPLGLLLQRDPETVEPGSGDLYEIGTT